MTHRRPAISVPTRDLRFLLSSEGLEQSPDRPPESVDQARDNCQEQLKNNTTRAGVNIADRKHVLHPQADSPNTAGFTQHDTLTVCVSKTKSELLHEPRVILIRHPNVRDGEEDHRSVLDDLADGWREPSP